MTADWERRDAEEHFFIYLERNGAADLLHPLGEQLATNPGLQEVASTLHANLKATAFAASTPYYVALSGAFEGRAQTIKRVVMEAAKTKNRDVLNAAAAVLSDSGAPIDYSFQVLQMVQDVTPARPALQALLRQATAMVWGAFETFTLDLLLTLLVEDLNLLREIADRTRRDGTVPWHQTAPRLLRWIEKHQNAAPEAPVAEIIASFTERMSMSIGAIRYLFGVLFPGDLELAARLGDARLTTVAARRHLLMHQAGRVTAEYIATTSEPVPLGSNLLVSPRNLTEAFQAVVSASAALLKTAQARLRPQDV